MRRLAAATRARGSFVLPRKVSISWAGGWIGDRGSGIGDCSEGSEWNALAWFSRVFSSFWCWRLRCLIIFCPFGARRSCVIGSHGHESESRDLDYYDCKICRCYFSRSLRAAGSETGGRHSVPVQTKARALPSLFRVLANGSTGPSVPRTTLFG